MSIFHIVSGFV